jgi:hypothetical protein
MPNQPVTYLIHCIVENRDAKRSTLGTDASDSSRTRGSAGAEDWSVHAKAKKHGNPVSSYLHSCIAAGDLEEIAYKDIAAIARKVDARGAEELVSMVFASSDEGASPPRDRFETYPCMERLKNWLVTYQQTNIGIFRHYTMLPLRFGTMVDRKDEVEEFMASSYLHIKWALDRLRGKAEFAVQVSWDLNAVLQEISQDEQWFHEAKGSIGSKIEIGRLLFQAADKKKKEIVDSVHRRLSAVSLDSSDSGIASGSMIMNRSYLIEKSAEGAFDEAMAGLGSESESYLSFKYVGPIPAYSFAPLQFKLGNFELIDDARRKLSLPERARFEEIKTSYRRLSLRYHPDKNPDDQQSAERFKQIDEAYRILEEYCYSCEGSLLSRKGAKYSFTKDDVEKVFVVEKRASIFREDSQVPAI